MRQAESFGNVAIEAMACKIPIIGTKTSALVEYIFDNQNGYLFKMGSSEDLALKINNFFYLNEKKKQEMADEAYAVALKYEKNKVNKKFVEKLKLI